MRRSPPTASTRGASSTRGARNAQRFRAYLNTNPKTLNPQTLNPPNYLHFSGITHGHQNKEPPKREVSWDPGWDSQAFGIGLSLDLIKA